MKDQVFEDKFLVAIINEEGGKIAMRQKDFNKALEKFKFAFHYYRDMGNEEEDLEPSPELDAFLNEFSIIGGYI